MKQVKFVLNGHYTKQGKDYQFEEVSLKRLKTLLVREKSIRPRLLVFNQN
jgi:hypothetical protein